GTASSSTWRLDGARREAANEAAIDDELGPADTGVSFCRSRGVHSRDSTPREFAANRNLAKRIAAIPQRAGAELHGLRAYRSVIRRKRAVANIRRVRDVRAACPCRVAYASARP